MMRHPPTLAVSLLLSLLIFSCTPTVPEQPPPEPTPPPSADASLAAPPAEDEAPQLGDEFGLCQSFPFDPKVKEMQPILLHLGYYRGALNGCKGPKSVAAVEEFQRDAGLPVTGEVDGATAAALREARSAKKRPAIKDNEVGKSDPFPTE